MILIINSDKLIENYIVKPITQRYCVMEEPQYNKFKYIRKIVLLMSIIKIFFLIKKYKVKAVVTLFHNSMYVQRMAKIFSNINFYFIQNGNMSKKELMRPFKNDISNFFCFGDYEKIVCNEFGHKVKNFFPVGNFRSSIYIDNLKSNSKNKYKITYISQLADWAFKEPLRKHDHKTIKKFGLELFYFLIKLSKEKNLKMSILCRGSKSSLEYNFYKKFVNKNLIDIFTSDSNPSYEVINQSELIISIFSTLSIEALRFNKKAILVDCSSDNIFSYYKKDIFFSDLIVYNESNLGNQEKKILYILGIDLEKYQKEIKKFADLVINKKTNTPTFIRIREKIMKDNFK